MKTPENLRNNLKFQTKFLNKTTETQCVTFQGQIVKEDASIMLINFLKYIINTSELSVHVRKLVYTVTAFSFKANNVWSK